MKALSIRQPWAFAILHLGKDIENRDWRYAPTFRGEFYIHASSGLTEHEYWESLYAMEAACADLLFPSFDALPRGGIVGKARIVDVVTQSNSPWFFGPMGFVLKDAQPVPFMPCRGALGFFDIPEQKSLL